MNLIAVVRCHLVTVSETGTPVLLDPDVAVTVTLEVPAGVPVAGVPPPEFVAGVVESLLLQLSSPTIAATIKQTVTRPISWLPCFFRPISNPTGTSAMGASTDASRLEEGTVDTEATAPPLVLIVNVVLTGPPAGVTVAGLKAQVAPTGRPPQLKLTG